MQEKTLEIATPDGVMETFVAHPDGEGPFPVVVLYMDAPGIRGELHDFVRRIADRGYYALVPDLYYRRGRIRLDLNDASVRAEMFAHMRSLTNAGVASDTRALLGALASEPAAADGPKGCIGYCMSGQFVMTVAGTFPEHFRASISCYGVAIVTDADDSPHRLADRVQGELFFAFAEKDEYVPPETIDTLRDTLDAAGVDYRLDVYPCTEHGFCFPERKWCYVEDAAEDVWSHSFRMFERQLG
ncbi:MAG: dienelactone hydrolase family protein [Myxococcota bacterium]